MNTEEMKDELSRELSEKRYRHSLGVCGEAVRMAELFGADTEKAYIAGLLHDCAKCLSGEELTKLYARSGADEDELKCPPVIHAPLGVVVAREKYGITDTEILGAIRYHTVARENMPLLEKIIYVADMTEPMRSFPGVESLRRLSEQDINLAFMEAVKQSLVYNLNNGNFIHPNTLKAWNYICKHS